MNRIANNLSRRALLKSGAAILGFSAIAPLAALAGSQSSSRQPLRIPPLDQGQMVDGQRKFDLAVGHGQMSFFSDVKTKTLGINGDYLAPVLRFRAGDKVQLNVSNTLQEATTLHWHGFNLPAASDGGPHQVIKPGGDWTAEFEVREKASTMWYHSHLMGKTADQVWAGLAGMIIVDDEEADALDLPDSYGIDDFPVVLQDRAFNSSGQIPYRLNMHSRNMGMAGDVALVNGTVAPYLDVTTSLVRLRLLNGSNSSIYSLGFTDGRAFQQIASDGGLLAAPIETKMVRLAPGERAEIVVDMSDQTPAMLRTFVQAGEMGGMMRGMGRMMEGGSPQMDFLELRPSANLKTSPALPASLTDLPAPNPQDATNSRQFVLQMQGMGMLNALTGGGFTINGKSMDPSYINEVVKMGETEVWQISNASMMAHPFHIHNTQFRILARDGAAPAAVEAGRKDTVLVNPGETVHILIRFDHYTDDTRPYMYHCHILEHEDAGMMGQFIVV